MMVISTLYNHLVRSGPLSAYKINGYYRLYEWTETIQRRSRRDCDCADVHVDVDIRYSNAITLY